MKSTSFVSTKGHGIMSAVDWSEFHIWSFVRQDLSKANNLLASLHSTPKVCQSQDAAPGTNATTLHEKLSACVHEILSLVPYSPPAAEASNHASARHNHSYTQFAAGAIGGGTATYATHWLDTIKVKMQTFPDLYLSGSQTLKVSVTTEGIRGLYKGVLPAVLGQTIKSAVVFTSYEFCEELVCQMMHAGQSEHLSLWDHATAGAMTGIMASFILCPLELIKCRQQALQNDTLANCKHKGLSSYKQGGLYGLTRSIIKADGFRGLYKGLPGIWIKEIPGSFIYFGSYEFGKSVVQAASHSDHIGSRGVFLSGMFAGLCFCVTHPIESVKTRVQVMSALSQTGGFFKSAATILRTEGIKPLCSGMRPTMVRACLFSGIQFMIYEGIKDFCLKH